MSWRKLRKTLITFCLAFLVGLIMSGLPFPKGLPVGLLPVLAQQSHLKARGQAVSRQPPAFLALRINNERRPLPGRREPAAGRGCGISMPKPPLTALSPETNLGFTVAAYPQFFFYIPQMSAKAVKYSLLKEDNHKVYEKTFPMPRSSGIFNLSLPADKTLSPLEVGRNYHWYLQLICPEQDSGDIYVDGWVQRVSGDRPSGGARGNRQNNLWYDTLATLAQKRRMNPQDAAIATQWANLLRAEGLNAISQEPLVGSLPGGES